MSKKVLKFINYVKEAFLWPTHLIAMGSLFVISLAVMIILGAAFDFVNPLPLLLVFGGIEMLYLGAITRNSRFIRAVNAKYAKEIQAFEKARNITEYYNGLSAPRQRRFEHFKGKLDAIRENYKNLHLNFPDLVNAFLEKINNLQLSYIRLLFMQDKFPEYVDRENPDEIQRQINELKNSMENDSSKLKDIKMKRLMLMEKRIGAFEKVKENGEIVGAQLQTIEEMIQYIQDQPVALKNTQEEDIIIDNILLETESLQNTISDLENIMNSDYRVGDYGDLSPDVYGMDTDRVTE